MQKFLDKQASKGCSCMVAVFTIASILFVLMVILTIASKFEENKNEYKDTITQEQYDEIQLIQLDEAKQIKISKNELKINDLFDELQNTPPKTKYVVRNDISKSMLSECKRCIEKFQKENDVCSQKEYNLLDRKITSVTGTKQASLIKISAYTRNESMNKLKVQIALRRHFDGESVTYSVVGFVVDGKTIYDSEVTITED